MPGRYSAVLSAGLLVASVVTACTSRAPAPTVQAVATSVATIQPAPTSTATPAPATTPASVPTVSVTALPTTSSEGEIPYLDDRSDAAAVLKSLFNAVNLHQFTQAYSYWDDTPERLTFDQFEAGYHDAASVQVILGLTGSDAGAGSVYASAPVTLIATTNAGTVQTFVGCYVLHLSQPAIQGTLPFRPWGIQSATMTQVDNNANTADLMSQACTVSGRPLPPTPIPDPNDVSPARYIDNRTGPVEVLKSLFNAINRREYVRAYSYWQSNTPDLPGLTEFTEGYSTTQVVTPTFGLVTPDAGAGQLRYTVPAAIKAGLSNGSQRTFVGCYVLHLSNPDLQAQPPFQPLAIESANVKQVPNDVDTGVLMNQMCALPNG